MSEKGSFAMINEDIVIPIAVMFSMMMSSALTRADAGMKRRH